jgi:type IV secretion system protein VirB3
MDSLNTEPLYVALTRPAMKFGVHLYGVFLEVMAFGVSSIWVGNPFNTLAIIAVMHLVQFVICWRNPGLYHNAYLWINTKGLTTNDSYWGCVSFSPSSNVGNKKCKKVKL